MVHIIGIIILIEFAGNRVSGGDNKSNDISNTSMRSNYAETLSDRSNTTTNQRSHTAIL
jgi:hypothetical protein